ncbi:retrovirus-related pol polyprotein from transposon TNT 1-94 [Tanacetum coccineum]
MQTDDVLIGDDLKHYEVEIEAMNLILISIPNDIYNCVDACTTAQAMWQRVERLMQGTVQNKVDRETRFNNEFDQFFAELGEALVSYVTHPSSVVDYDDDYQGGAFKNNYEDPLTSAMMLLALAITQRFSNPTNNHLRNSSNTINQAIVQADRVNIQSRNSSNDGRNTRRSYVQEEIIEGSAANVQCYNYSEKGHYARNCPKPKELSANICLMARIQPVNIDFDEGPSYDSAFLSEVQKPSTSYVNSLFAKDNQEQKYLKQPNIINDTIGNDQIDSNIIFDEPNVDVNSGSVEYDNNVQASYELEQLAIMAYKEAKKQQINANKVKQQNKVLTQQLELYKEKVWVFEMTKGNNTTFLTNSLRLRVKQGD